MSWQVVVFNALIYHILTFSIPSLSCFGSETYRLLVLRSIFDFKILIIMGDVAVSALVKDVLGRLTSEVIKELALLWGLKDDLSNLKDDFEQIEAVLEDAEERHIKERAVELWLQRLRSASLKVLENLLDEISTQAMLQRLHKDGGIKCSRVRAFFSSHHNQLMFRVRIAHKVKAMRTKLDDIASKRFVLNT
ncbi:putative virus X resistance protein-like, coiled-coil [Helianthus debilis subsp. tardiflorus]